MAAGQGGLDDKLVKELRGACSALHAAMMRRENITRPALFCPHRIPTASEAHFRPLRDSSGIRQEPQGQL